MSDKEAGQIKDGQENSSEILDRPRKKKRKRKNVEDETAVPFFEIDGALPRKEASTENLNVGNKRTKKNDSEKRPQQFRIDHLGSVHSLISYRNGLSLGFWGYGEMLVVDGAVTMMGYKINCEEKPRFYSIASSTADTDVVISSNPSFRRRKTQNPNDSEISKLFNKNEVCCEDEDVDLELTKFQLFKSQNKTLNNIMLRLCRVLKSFGVLKIAREHIESIGLGNVILLCRRTSRQDMEFLNTCFYKQRIFPTLNNFKTHHRNVFEKCHDLVLIPPVRKHVYPELYDEVLKKYDSYLIDNDSAATIVVSGAQDTGKSTFCRYIINHFLNKYKAICYLDCDIGQTEFNPPGCVALHTITKPVVGPPYSHQQKADSIVYTGAVSPADPEFYYRCLQHVLSNYQSRERKPPLVVNFMGWMQGVGLQHLVAAISASKAHLVVQLDQCHARDPKMNYDDFVRIHGEASSMYTTFPQALEKPFEFLYLPVVPKSDQKDSFVKKKLKNPQLRDLALVAHLGKAITEPAYDYSYFLNGVTPHAIPWNKMALHVCDHPVKNSMILYALNGTVVALVKVDPSLILSSDDETLPLFLKEKPVAEFLGFGLLRAIDPDKKIHYIVTSIGEEEVKRANCLLKGTVSLPDFFYTQQRNRFSSKIPYVSYCRPILGSAPLSRDSREMAMQFGAERKKRERMEEEENSE